MWVARAARGKARGAGSHAKVVKMGIHVPKELHRRFRARLVLEGRLMQDTIREWVDEEVASHRTRPPASGGLRFFKGVDRSTLAALAVPVDQEKIRRLKSKLLLEGRNISQWGTERMEQFLKERA
ncbi:MAG TPA: hypothetical protein VK881_08910 [bacterium]|nr:hypothetical protein [bacterium]